MANKSRGPGSRVPGIGVASPRTVSVPFAICATACSIAVAALLFAELTSSRLLAGIAKPVASLAFVAAALSRGAGASGSGSSYGVWVLAALVLSFFGDVFLLSRGKRWFLAGLGAFLLGHVAYAGAFVARGASPSAAAAALLLLTPCSALVARWLLPKVPPSMKAPVGAYTAVITVMVASAAGTVAEEGDPLVLAAAVAFYLSDLSVARDRFVRHELGNKLWGLPLYYGAQLLFAWTVG